MTHSSDYRMAGTSAVLEPRENGRKLPPIEISYFDPRTGAPSPTKCAPLHADGRAGIKRDANGNPLAPLPKRAKPRGQREAESRRRGNAASAKARGKRGARL